MDRAYYQSVIAKSDGQEKLTQAEYDARVENLLNQRSNLLDELPENEQLRLIAISEKMILETEEIIAGNNRHNFCDNTTQIEFDIRKDIVRPQCIIENDTSAFEKKAKARVQLKDLRDVRATREECMHAILGLKMQAVDTYGAIIPDAKVARLWEQFQHLELIFDDFLTKALDELSASEEELRIGNEAMDSSEHKKLTVFNTVINKRALSSSSILTTEWLELEFDLVHRILSEYSSDLSIEQLFKIFNVAWGYREMPGFQDIKTEFFKRYCSINQIDFDVNIQIRSSHTSENELKQLTLEILQSKKLLEEDRIFFNNLYIQLEESSLRVRTFLDLIFYVFDSSNYLESIYKCKRVVQSLNDRDIMNAHKLWPDSNPLIPEDLSLSRDYFPSFPRLGNLGLSVLFNSAFSFAAVPIVTLLNLHDLQKTIWYTDDPSYRAMVDAQNAAQRLDDIGIQSLTLRF